MGKKNGNRQQNYFNRKEMRDTSSSGSIIKAEGNVSITENGILPNATIEYQGGFGKPPDLIKKDIAVSNIDDFVEECTLLSGNGFYNYCFTNLTFF